MQCTVCFELFCSIAGEDFLFSYVQFIARKPILHPAFETSQPAW